MTTKLEIFFHKLTGTLITWSDPAWWICISLLLFTLSMVHFVPLILEDNNHKTKDHFFLLVRRGCLIALVGLGLIFPIILYFLFSASSGESNQVASDIFKEWVLDMSSQYWMAPLSGLVSGVFLNMIWHRYLEPYMSNISRRFRVNQAEDKLSDIRTEAKSHTAKNFVPEHYFKDGYYFLGLDGSNQPIYVEAKKFEETHAGYFGPTGFGKGVLAGVVLTQAIRRGNMVVMVDPKDDDNLPYILQNEAKKAGRQFVYLDLNNEGKGAWHPFKGGTPRDRRTRMIAAFGLEKGGTNADVYKSKERGYVDDLLAATDGSIRDMLEATKKFTDGDSLSSLRDGLREWSQISTFMPPKKKDGHSIEKSILNNAVVYIRGSTGDGVVRAATKAYISEFMQEAKRLKNQRTTHITTFFDELRFVISNEIVDALATIRTFKVNMNLATQSIGDLLNIQDATINGPALKQSFEINCQLKFLYNAGDKDTAEWGEAMSGTKMLRIARNERTETNRWGGEKWDKMRSFDNQEAPNMHRNVLLSLPPRVAIFYMPGTVATVIFTCWVSADKSFASWEKRKLPAEDSPSNQDTTTDKEVAEGDEITPQKLTKKPASSSDVAGQPDLFQDKTA